MGGNAFKDVGTIHIDEISPTLDYIGCKTNIKDIRERVLGSVGKKEYSGDIDLALEKNDVEQKEFIASLKEVLGQHNVKRLGKLVTTRVPIQKYSADHASRQPRTGFVQVDFVFGNVEWLKLFYHSPCSTESKLKGTHRNLAISSVAGFVDREESEELDSFERPIRIVRWKWSPNDGLVKVLRTSQKNVRTGDWIKKQHDVVLTEPEYSAEKIASIIFKGKVGASALNSAESVIDAVKTVYDKETQAEIFKRMAFNFKEHRIEKTKQYDYPLEVVQYMEEDGVSGVDKSLL
jgi:hypothetical protein